MPRSWSACLSLHRDAAVGKCWVGPSSKLLLSSSFVCFCSRHFCDAWEMFAQSRDLRVRCGAQRAEELWLGECRCVLTLLSHPSPCAGPGGGSPV